MSDQLRELIASAAHHARMHRPSERCEKGPFARDYEIADAVLALFDVEVEYGLTWPPTGDVDWVGTEYEARATLRIGPAGLNDPSRLVRRHVLTTKPLPVELISTPTESEGESHG